MKTSLKTQKALERVVDAVATSYEGGRPIDSLESTALPNRRKVVEALSDLEHVCFMGYYSAETLSTVNLRHYISQHIYSSSDILVGQIARALVYNRIGGGAPEHEDLVRSERIVTDLMSELPQIRDQLSHDVEAAFDGDPSAQSIEEIIFAYPALQAITVYRIAHRLYLKKVPLVPRMMAEHAHSMTGIEIHPGAQIGRRFFVDHGTGVVVGETAVIGDDVKLYQGVTLGALSLPRDGTGAFIRNKQRHPTIENNVTIYANATILGGDTVIGEGSVIGANTWITDSVPPNTRVSYSAYHGNRQQRESLTPRESATPKE